MPEHGHAHHGPPDTSKGYEQSDLGIPGILKGVVAYFIFTGAVAVVVFVAFFLFHQNNPNPDELGPTRLPAQPYPLLQNDVTAHTDIWNLRGKEAYLLENTTYVDKSKGILRIPIEDAIDQAAKAGPNAAPDSAVNIKVSVDNVNPGAAMAPGGEYPLTPPTSNQGTPSPEPNAAQPIPNAPLNKPRSTRGPLQEAPLQEYVPGPDAPRGIPRSDNQTQPPKSQKKGHGIEIAGGRK